jgi:Na+/proline symporter
MYKRIGIFLLAVFAVAIALAIGDSGSRNSQLGVSSAQAVVGRPLTPVSVAGVARRTARRCAAGVYYC